MIVEEEIARLKFILTGNNANHSALEGSYYALGEIVKASPESAKDAIELIKVGLKNENNDDVSLRKAYSTLGEIVKASPEFAKDAIEAIKVGLNNKENDPDSLYRAYKVLGEIAQASPENSKDAIEAIKVGLNNEKNTENTLERAYEALGKIAQASPENAKDAIELIKVRLQNENNNVYSLRYSYSALGEIVKASPESAKDAIELIKVGLNNKNNKGRSLEQAYIALGEIVKASPENAKDAIEAIKFILNNENNDGYSLEQAYIALGEIAQASPENAKDAIELIKVGLNNENSYGVSLRDAYSTLREIAQASPENSKDAIEAIKVGLNNEENTEDSLERAYEELGEIAKASPENSKDAIELIKVGLNNKNNDGYSLMKAYFTLGEIVNASPEFAKDAIELIKVRLQNENNNVYSLRYSYSALGEIVKASPESAKDAIELIKVGLKNENNKDVSLEQAYIALGKIVKASPETAKDAIELIKVGLNNKNKYGVSLGYSYSALGEIVNASPEFAKDAIELIKVRLQNENNNVYSLRYSYSALGEIVKASPESAKDAIELIKVGLKNENNKDVSLEQAYIALGKIVKASPEFAKDAIELIKVGLNNKNKYGVSLGHPYSPLCEIVETSPESAKDAIEAIKVGLNNENNSGASLGDSYSALGKIVKASPESAKDAIEAIKVGLKNENNNGDSLEKICDVHNTICKHLRSKKIKFEDLGTDDEAIVKSFKKTHNMSVDENNYLLEKCGYSYEKIAEYNVSAQQRLMNVLVSELAQENGIPKEDAKIFRKGDNEELSELIKTNKDWIIPASFKGADVFGCYFPSYIKKAMASGLNIHDSVYFLPEDMGAEKNTSFRIFLQNNISYNDENGGTHTRPLGELEIIARNWKELTKEQEKLKYKEILAACKSKIYVNQKYDNLAIEAANFGYSQNEYTQIEDIYQAGLAVPEPFNSSKKIELTSANGTKYTGRFLPRDDVRTMFFGNHTDCCQHYGGAGEACAISTVKDDYSQLFVIEDEKGKIVAGSWVWENTSGRFRDVCFDNIEALGDYKSHPIINQMYETLANYLVKEENCHKITIGLGYQDADTSKYAKDSSPIKLPARYGKGYSDAKSQVILKQNPLAKPLEKEESKRYIRDVCFLDENAMDKVSEKCFPESDARIMIPEEMSGKVLVDSEKGLVGYCLYDEKEKHIYDMAVLDEYRKDKNASSKKLFLEVQKAVRKQGGEWTAEAREGTSLKYLEIMEKRGLLKLEKGEVDHEMGDGTKVYKVRFNIQSLEEQKEQLKQNKDKNQAFDINKSNER